MPSALHEALLELFRHRPALAAELLGTILGLDVPAYRQARLDPTDLTDVVPTEFRAERVVVCRDGADRGDGELDRAVLAIVVEVQLEPDADKRWSWPAYVGTLRSRLKCPTELLVICPRPATARWCGAPIPLGLSGSYLVPLVLGPDRIPVVTRLAETVDGPELAVLSALAHGASPDAQRVVEVLSDALGTIETRQATRYLQHVLAALPGAARSHLEELMETGTHTYQSEFTERLRDEGRDEGRDQGRDEGRDQGRVESRAAAVLTVLDATGVDVPDAARDRIIGCADLDQLDRWLRRAVTAASVEDVFA